jgi:hypothetical protein
MGASPNNTELASHFATVAHEFCCVIDSASNLDRIELLVQVYGVLPRLVVAALGLPNLMLNEDDGQGEESEDSRVREKFRLSDAQWRQLYEFLNVKLGDLNSYWVVWDPQNDDKAIRGSLADDFADIYRDLKGGLNLSEAHQSLPEDVIWHWRFDYYSHWGKHAFDALRAIHSLLDEVLT